MSGDDIRKKVDEDIIKCHECLDEYDYDCEKMAPLFHGILLAYKDAIEGFSDNLQVIQPYEGSAGQAKAYRENLYKMLDSLEAFRDNGYSNEGLMEYYLRRERQEVSYDADFSSLRMEIGVMEGLSAHEKDDIIEKLGEMEEICSRVMLRWQKWELLRGYLVWLSGKNVDIAMKILPIFFKINDL